jgi:diacylglycerol kinase family enzyme
VPERRSGYLLVNPRSGGGKPSTVELVDAAEKLGIRCHVLGDSDDASELARGADTEALGMAGGDGSLASVAEVAVERGLPFVCVPLGTRNHFARDLGLDRNDPFAALAAFSGAERRVDVARVNDRLFLNNVSIGVYANLVRGREQHRRRGEALAGVRALTRLARERHRLRVALDGETLRARILLIGNNAYDLDLFTLGERESLATGELHLYAADGWLPTTWVERAAARFRLELDAPHVTAAADGEPLALSSPLAFECQAQALRVLVPR